MSILYIVYSTTRVLVGCTPLALTWVVLSLALTLLLPLYAVASQRAAGWVYSAVSSSLYVFPLWVFWTLVHYAREENHFLADLSNALFTLDYTWVDNYLVIVFTTLLVVYTLGTRYALPSSTLLTYVGSCFLAPAPALASTLAAVRKAASNNVTPSQWGKAWVGQTVITTGSVAFTIWCARFYYWIISPATCLTSPLHFRLIPNPLQALVLVNAVLIKGLVLTFVLETETPGTIRSMGSYVTHAVFTYLHTALGLSMALFTADFVSLDAADALARDSTTTPIPFDGTATLGRIAIGYSLFVATASAWFVLNLSQVEVILVGSFFALLAALAHAGNAPPARALGEWILSHKLETSALLLSGCGLMFAGFTHWGAVPWEVTLFQEFFSSNRVFLALTTLGKLLIVAGAVWGGKSVLASKNLRWWYRFLIIIPSLVLIIHATTKFVDPCTLQPGLEYPEPNEAASIQRLIDITSGVVAKETDLNIAYRDVHRKMHGCVRGEFRINDWVPEHLRVGLFAESGTSYPAWIRFSNGQRLKLPDTVPDVRGMAIKLCGVPGPKAGNVEGGEDTADFVLVSADTFFASKLSTYPDVLEGIVKGGPKGALKILGTMFPSLNPTTWDFSILNLGRLFYSGFIMANPLTSPYFSVTPYALGFEPPATTLYDAPLAVKYSVKPCNADASEAIFADQLAWGSSPDYLREAMDRWLSAGEACFDFGVAEQGLDACQNPLEDITVSWTDRTGYNQAVYVPVARLTIPKQEFTFDSQYAFCQALSYNVFQTPVAHRPLGSISRARGAVYNATSAVRHAINHVDPPQPTCTETFSGHKVGMLKGSPEKYDYTTVFDPFSNMPRYLKDIPQSQQYEFEFYNSHGKVFASAYAKSLLRIKEAPKPVSEWDSLNEWARVFDMADTNSSTEALHANLFTLPVPRGYPGWDDDAVFARTYLTGTNPVIITRVSASTPLPAALDTHPDSVSAANALLASRGVPPMDVLEAEGKLFFADYHLLEGSIIKDAFVLYSPIVVFYLDTVNVPTEGKNPHPMLMPLAIQLTRGERGPNAGPHAWYTPADKPEAWLFAKMHVSSADCQFHEAGAHLGPIHLTLEPILIAFFRAFSQAHPVYKFLHPHTYGTFAVNNMGRFTLVAPKGSQFENLNSVGLDGILELMMRNYNHEWSWDGNAFDNELASRGFSEIKSPEGDSDPLPGYYYRDDGFKVWHAIHAYCADAVDVMYGSDAEVDADQELQGFFFEVTDVNGANITSIPEVHTKADLSRWLSNFIFTATAQHAAVSLSQYDYYAFAPARPTTMSLPMPADRNTVTLQYIKDSLPSPRTVVHSLGLVRLLSTPTLGPHASWSSLVDVPVHPDFATQYASFKQKCQVIEAQILARNAASDDPYLFLRPSQIPYSLSS